MVYLASEGTHSLRMMLLMMADDATRTAYFLCGFPWASGIVTLSASL
jgi:hypothetical protein